MIAVAALKFWGINKVITRSGGGVRRGRGQRGRSGWNGPVAPQKKILSLTLFAAPGHKDAEGSCGPRSKMHYVLNKNRARSSGVGCGGVRQLLTRFYMEF